MKFRYSKFNVLITFFVLLLSFFLFLLFILDLAGISIFEGNYTSECEFINTKVEIYKNQYGIPHVMSENISDAFFGIGFVQASDRLWQMDYLRRVAKGELSEILGKDAIKLDQYFRSLQLKKSSEIVLKNLDTFSLRLLESFSNGVNFYIERFSNKLPVEFQALNYKPNRWTPLDCILIGRLMAFTMSFSFWLDLTFFDIANKIGYEKAFLLLPNRFENFDEFLSDTFQIKQPQFDSTSTKQIFGYKLDHDVLSTVERFYPFICGQKGSNTWAIQSKTNSGTKAILASDPHLKLSLPPFWYQIHITTSKFNVVGLCLPGVPLPLIGRNDYISWGITNGMLDDCDFFVYSLDSTAKFVIDSVRTLKISYKLDTIKVKNSPDFIYYQRFIGEDILISDFLLLKDSISAPKFYDISNSPKLPPNFAFTFKWTGQFFSNEFKALYLICSAKNWSDFLNSKKFWGSPALNFSYADIRGNIGLMLAGYVPVRNNVHPNFPTFLIRRNSSWVGVEKLDSEFNIYNPKEGIIFNANNKTFSPSIYLGNYWSDPSRAYRILKMLTQSRPDDVLNMQVMQMDRFSEQSEYVLRRILPILNKNVNSLNNIEKLALDKLKSWNYVFSENYVAPTIYQVFLVTFLENLLKDELGEPILKQLLYLDFIANRKFLEFISDSTTVFYDDLTTPEIEDREQIVIKSFKLAIQKISKLFNSNFVDDWKYGKIHKVKLEHPFSIINFLEPSFSIEETTIGGHNSTINYAGGKLFKLEKVEVGPSARFIADMNDTVVFTILPGGNSGQNFSKNYSDQFQLWLRGGYITIPMSKKPDTRFKLFAKISAPRNTIKN